MKKLNVRILNKNDIQLIMKLQNSIISNLDNKELLRKNTQEMFESCLNKPNITLGVFDGSKLVALAIGVDARATEEDLSIGLLSHFVERPFNYKSTMVDKEYRGLGLQKKLIKIIEMYACSRGYTDLCATVSEDNLYSINNMLACGFERDHEAIKYGTLKRTIMCKKIIPTKVEQSILEDELLSFSNKEIEDMEL